jgi:protein SCO1
MSLLRILRRTSRRALGAAFALLTPVILGLGGCGQGNSATVSGEFRGIELHPPVAAPDFTLTATDGRPYHLKPEIEGTVALLFFGYTHCPDVCPVHMTAIASALRSLPLKVSQRVRVIFVTVDPKRDQPARLRSWLDNFDPGFVGLRGPEREVNRIQTALHLVPATVEAGPESTYSVGHGAAVIAVIADSARVLYPFGTREVDWLHDLPELVAAIPPGATP